jgi:hypothetical protein
MCLVNENVGRMAETNKPDPPFTCTDPENIEALLASALLLL